MIQEGRIMQAKVKVKRITGMEGRNSTVPPSQTLYCCFICVFSFNLHDRPIRHPHLTDNENEV